MRFSWGFLAIPVAFLAPSACANTDEHRNHGSGGGAGGEFDHLTITLSADHTIDLKPGELAPITATVSPPGVHAVGFALLGDASDAALERTAIKTDASGVARTTLHAPSQATTFQLRAAILDAGTIDVTDTVAVAVSKNGFATLDLFPQYGGVRDVTIWTAQAVTRTSCAALAPTLPDLPPGLDVSAMPNHALVLEDVPVGPPVAVVVRAGHFAWGCVDSPPLLPNKKTNLGVVVVDKPLDLAATRLDFSLDFAPDPADLTELAVDALGVVEDAVFQQSQDATFLLDQMQLLAQGDFAGARQTYAWDSTTQQHLASRNVDLRSQVEAWAYAGLGVQPPSLRVRVTGSELLADQLEAKVTVLALGTFSANEAGLAKVVTATWLAQSDDVVALGGFVPWRPSALVSSATLVGAKAEYAGVTSVGQACGLVVDCTGLGMTLGGYPGCDGGCLATLCQDALSAAWSAAASASHANTAELSISISGSAKVDDVAAPSSVLGSWLGVLGDGFAQATVMGMAKATKTGSQTPP
jgi:hypothetical protein